MHKFKVSDVLPKDQKLISFESDTAIESAIKKLAENKILSAPVFDKGTLTGFVDYLDIVAYVIKAAPEGKDIARHNLKALEMAGRAMALESVSRVLNESGRNAAVEIHADAPLSELVDLFSRGVHRVAVFSDASKGALTGVVSQSNFVAWLAPHLHQSHLKELGNKALATLSMVQGQTPTSANLDDAVLKVLHHINSGSRGAVALLDRDGKIAGVFSASDVRGLYQENLPDFLQECQTYLTTYSPGSLTPTVVRPETLLNDAIKELVDNKVHRVFIIDNDYKPIGVVTLTDVIKEICNFQYTAAVH